MEMIKYILFLILFSSTGLWAKTIGHSEFNFHIGIHKMKAGEVHYAFVNVDKEKFIKEAGPFAGLLTIPHPTEKSKYALIRSVFPIRKPVGSIDSDKFNDLDFVKKILAKKNTRKVKENTYFTGTSFVKYHFDSDDLTSMPDSRIAGKVAELKFSDPLLQSASSAVFKNTYAHKDHLKEDSEFYGFISLDESITLVVYIKMVVFPEGKMNEQNLEKKMLQDVLNIRKVLTELAP